MAIKRIIGRCDKRFRSCLSCGQHIDRVLKDDEVYTCERCGQQHLIDVYVDHVVLTVIERPEIRRRPTSKVTPQQQRARKVLVARVESRKLEADAWEEKYRDWLEELAELPESEREVEFSFMDEEMLRRVKKYLDKRTTA